jgi:arginyl-tRNA synthetase
MKQELEHLIETVIKELFAVNIKIELTRPDEQFGDYATNVALSISRQVGQNPLQIAKDITAKLKDKLVDKVSEISVVAPGFINLKLNDKFLAHGLDIEVSKPLVGKKVIIEYSDPNPFKPLHAGHLYQTLVGDIIARMLECSGANVVRINYGGDVGLHVGKSLWAIIKKLGGELPDRLQDIPESERPAWLGVCYVEGNVAYEDDESAKAEIIEINKRVYRLHAKGEHDSPFARLYFTCRQWSYDYFKELYEKLEVTPFDRYIPESEITPVGIAAVEEQLSKGVYQESKGAVVFRGEAVGLHTRVFITAEGIPTYEAKDVGLSLTKWRDYNFDESIIITGNEQAQYMAVVIASIKQFAPESVSRTRHLTHGLVKLKGGVKMSSRHGNVVTAMQILESAREAGAKSETKPSEETILAAVKYAFAKNRIGADIIYDPEESIALEGNSGPYLQYAHARACSILAKADRQANTELIRLEPAERSLLRKITQYPEVVDKAATELLPHYICTYLYELAQAFNAFYESNRVIGAERQVIRLQLVKYYAETLKSGLSLLGITAPERL